MKYYHSFWSKPHITKLNLSQTKISVENQRFLFEINVLYQCLSCVLAKKNLKNIHLITDKLGKKLFIDQLGLPYSSYSCELESLNGYSENLWALGKIKSYQLITEPFLHIDNDLFIWDDITERLINSDIIVQNIDSESSYYNYTLKLIESLSIDLPNWLSNQISNNDNNLAINAGVLGGNDFTFINEFANEVIYFINKNQSKSDQIDNSSYAVLYEQFFFKQYCDLHKREINTLIPENLVINGEIKDINNSLLFNLPFCHLISHKKYEQFSYHYASFLLRKESLDIFNRFKKFKYSSHISSSSWH